MIWLFLEIPALGMGVRGQSLAEAQREIDVATFTQGLDAYKRDESELAASYPQALSSGVQAGMRRLGRS